MLLTAATCLKQWTQQMISSENDVQCPF